jgi:hypothetical protein
MSEPENFVRTERTACPPFTNITEFGVGSWCPTPDGSGKPEAVVFHFKTREMEPVEFCLRLKTRKAVDNLIAMLIEHRDHVFP